MTEMLRNTNEWFKSLIEDMAYQRGLEITKGIETTVLIMLWLMTPWLGLYGVINRLVCVLNGRF